MVSWSGWISEGRGPQGVVPGSGGGSKDEDLCLLLVELLAAVAHPSRDVFHSFLEAESGVFGVLIMHLLFIKVRTSNNLRIRVA